MTYQDPPFKEGDTVYIMLHGNLREGNIKYRWGNGDYQIKVKGYRASKSRKPSEIWHEWDIKKAEESNDE